MLSIILRNKKLLALLLTLSPSPALAQNQTRNGAVLGGVTGAVIGGIVGKQNDETTEGALIGGAVGAVAGGLLGNHKRQQEQQAAQQRYAQQQAQQRYYEQQRAQQHFQQQRNQNGYIVQQQPIYVQSQPVYVESQPTHVVTTPAQPQSTTPLRRGVTVADIMTLAKNGVSENVIRNHIESTGVAYQISVDDVVSMSGAGVSDSIIEAMQNAPIVGGNVNPIPRAIPNSKTLSPTSPTASSQKTSSQTTSRVIKTQAAPTRVTNTPTPAKRPVTQESTPEPLLLKPVPLPSGKF
jgi:hypothetical protein